MSVGEEKASAAGDLVLFNVCTYVEFTRRNSISECESGTSPRSLRVLRTRKRTGDVYFLHNYSDLGDTENEERVRTSLVKVTKSNTAWRANK
jgi:hypothetical protein